MKDYNLHLNDCNVKKYCKVVKEVLLKCDASTDIKDFLRRNGKGDSKPSPSSSEKPLLPPRTSQMSLAKQNDGNFYQSVDEESESIESLDAGGVRCQEARASGPQHQTGETLEVDVMGAIGTEKGAVGTETGAIRPKESEIFDQEDEDQYVPREEIDGKAGSNQDYETFIPVQHRSKPRQISDTESEDDYAEARDLGVAGSAVTFKRASNESMGLMNKTYGLQLASPAKSTAASKLGNVGPPLPVLGPRPEKNSAPIEEESNTGNAAPPLRVSGSKPERNPAPTVAATNLGNIGPPLPVSGSKPEKNPASLVTSLGNMGSPPAVITSRPEENSAPTLPMKANGGGKNGKRTSCAQYHS